MYTYVSIPVVPAGLDEQTTVDIDLTLCTTCMKQKTAINTVKLEQLNYLFLF